MTEVEVFLAVFESCVAFDNSLDVLRLAQPPDGYVGYDDFWTKRQDPYDSLANALFGTVAKVAPMLFRGVIDNAPKWRASLPSWVPDWTQWTHSDMDDRDIALIRSYSTRVMWNRPLLDATNGTKLARQYAMIYTTQNLPQEFSTGAYLRQTAQESHGYHGPLKIARGFECRPKSSVL